MRELSVGDRKVEDGATAADPIPVPPPGIALPRRRPPLGTILAIAMLAVALVAIARATGTQVPRLIAWVESLGMWAPLVYVGAYVVAAVLFVPGAIPTMAAGALFGLGWGTVYAFIGETLGGTAAFWVSRRVTRHMVERHLVGTPRFAAIDRAVAAEGRRIVFLLRLSPVMPFNVVNYLLGITKVRFVDYLVGSLGMLPGALLYVYYGKLAGDVAAVAAGDTAAPPRDALYWTALAGGLVATVLVTTVVTRAAQRALRTATLEAAPKPGADCNPPPPPG